MGLLGSVKDRLGFDNGDSNWEDEEEYYEEEEETSGRRRSASGRSYQPSSSSRSFEDTVAANNRELASRYNNTEGIVRTREAGAGRISRNNTYSSSSSYDSFRSSFGSSNDLSSTPLVSYADIKSSQYSGMNYQRGAEDLSHNTRSASDNRYNPYDNRGAGDRNYSLSAAYDTNFGSGNRFDDPSTDTGVFGSVQVPSSRALGNAERRDLASSSSNSLKALYAERTRLESRDMSAGGYDSQVSTLSYGSNDDRGIESPHLSMRMPRKIRVIKPQVYDDVESVAKGFKGGDLIVLSLAGTSPELARRILDFSFGVVSALDGTVECMGERLFLLIKGSPLTEAERSQLQREGIL